MSEPEKFPPPKSLSIDCFFLLMNAHLCLKNWQKEKNTPEYQGHNMIAIAVGQWSKDPRAEKGKNLYLFGHNKNEVEKYESHLFHAENGMLIKLLEKHFLLQKFKVYNNKLITFVGTWQQKGDVWDDIVFYVRALSPMFWIINNQRCETRWFSFDRCPGCRDF